MESITPVNQATRSYTIQSGDTVVYLKEFPVVKLEGVSRATLSMYGVVRKDDKILLQGDYSTHLVRGRDGIKQPDGRFVWPFVAIGRINPTDKKHHEFCFVYNLYGENDMFTGHRRCDSTFILNEL